ncbi:hypothetical protein N9V13_05560 [Betaproteobacteria bacterium]|nr:hypothetical protein [Betaproteobacteria bacterium]
MDKRINRKKLFEEFTSQIKEKSDSRFEKQTDYLVKIKLLESEFKTLRINVLQFLSARLFGKDYDIKTEEKIIDLFQKDKTDKLLTTSGLILPKRDSLLEFNLVILSFYKIMQRYLSVYGWYEILPLRVKTNRSSEKGGARRNSSVPHLDSWTGFSDRAYLCFLPLLGDIEKNTIALWDPLVDIDEQWHEFNITDARARDIVQRYYKKLDVKLETGYLYVAESSVIHATEVQEEATARVSIDQLFLPDWARYVGLGIQNENRLKDFIKVENYESFPHEYIYDFHDSPNVKRPTNGLRSPVGRKKIILSKRVDSEKQITGE